MLIYERVGTNSHKLSATKSGVGKRVRRNRGLSYAYDGSPVARAVAEGASDKIGVYIDEVSKLKDIIANGEASFSPEAGLLIFSVEEGEEEDAKLLEDCSVSDVIDDGYQPYSRINLFELTKMFIDICSEVCSANTEFDLIFVLDWLASVYLVQFKNGETVVHEFSEEECSFLRVHKGFMYPIKGNFDITPDKLDSIQSHYIHSLLLPKEDYYG